MGKKGDGDVLVKVGRTGARTVEVALNGDRTIDAALRAAGFSQKDSEVVQVNGEEVDDVDDYKLKDGDRVILIKNVQAGY